ncbi:MAG: arginine--tRNA ligase, partial [Candidatus Zixiibacteriota bacterium]
LSKLLNDKPPTIASSIANIASIIIKKHPDEYQCLSEISNAGGYINVNTDFTSEAYQTINDILNLKSEYGSSDEGNGHKILVEYSSVNIAKPFGVGHLRTTILGNSLRHIFNKIGCDVVGINYLGDWGTQFGKMIVAFQEWGSGINSGNESVSDLLELYVKFHDEAEKDDSLNDRARQAFQKLETGDKELTALWERFKNISMKEFKRVYNLLGVEFDWITGESFLNDKMEPVIQRLKKASLTSISEGALIVDLNDPQLPPCLLIKADGATLYSTREITGILYRWDTYHFDEMLYVVASAQSDHFKQIFKVLTLLEEAEKTSGENIISKRIKHIEFGWVKFGDKTMSTRRGNIIFLEDVINKAVDLIKTKIIEKNPNLKKIDETASIIGVGAVIFSQLSVRRQKDVNFNWAEVLNFEGETGPYLQYTHARLSSLLRNYDDDISSDIEYDLLHNEEEQRIIELLADFPDAVHDAAKNYEPFIISAYLIKLAGAFNKFYQRKDETGRIDKIISNDKNLSLARIALVKSTQTVIKEGLKLLGIQAPEEM